MSFGFLAFAMTFSITVVMEKRARPGEGEFLKFIQGNLPGGRSWKCTRFGISSPCARN